MRLRPAALDLSFRKDVIQKGVTRTGGPAVGAVGGQSVRAMPCAGGSTA